MNDRKWRLTPVGVAGLVVAGVVGCFGALSAQERAGNSKIVVIGCITQTSGAANAPMAITDLRGGPAAAFQLDPTDAKLTFHVGHTVELSGTLVAGTGGGATASAGPARLKVDSVQYVSASCWTTPKK